MIKVCQSSTHFLKSVNCIPTFEIMSQLGSFQTKITNVVNGVSRVNMRFFNIFLIFNYLFLQKKIATCQVPRVTHDIVSVRWQDNATCQCHYQMSLS